MKIEAVAFITLADLIMNFDHAINIAVIIIVKQTSSAPPTV